MAKKKSQELSLDSQETATPVKQKHRTHTVEKGDNLPILSSKYLGDTSRYEEIKRLNNLPHEFLCIGRVLLIPEK